MLTGKAFARELKLLKKSARESAEFRGHVLRNFITTRKGAFSFCVVCGSEVSCIVNPLPNEIDIAGTAVAVHCNGVALSEIL